MKCPVCKSENIIKTEKIVHSKRGEDYKTFQYDCETCKNRWFDTQDPNYNIKIKNIRLFFIILTIILLIIFVVISIVLKEESLIIFIAISSPIVLASIVIMLWSLFYKKDIIP